MRAATIIVYPYDQLTDKAKAVAREWYRIASAGDTDYAEHVTEDAKVVLGYCGFAIKEIHWSGFASQGDGACFEGNWLASYVDAKQLRDYAPKDEELHRIVDGLAELAKYYPKAGVILTHRGPYLHEQSIRFEDVDHDPFSNDAYAKFCDLARDAMRWIYRNLETEYEHVNSDEAIAEMILANMHEFTINGKHFTEEQR